MPIYNSIVDLVGNTPLIRLNAVTQGCGAQIVGKAEFFNPLSSVKDRIVVLSRSNGTPCSVLGIADMARSHIHTALNNSTVFPNESLSIDIFDMIAVFSNCDTNGLSSQYKGNRTVCFAFSSGGGTLTTSPIPYSISDII